MSNSAHPLFDIWTGMRQRCYNPKTSGYKYYGGRGIKVCKRWLSSFQTFVRDMGERPSPKHSIDRMDSDGDYRPSNCRWATPKQQAEFHRRSTLPVGSSQYIGTGFDLEMLEMIDTIGVLDQRNRAQVVHRIVSQFAPILLESLRARQAAKPLEAMGGKRRRK